MRSALSPSISASCQPPRRRRWLVVPLAFAAVSGCALEDEARLTETAYPRAADAGLAAPKLPASVSVDSHGIADPSAASSLPQAAVVPPEPFSPRVPLSPTPANRREDGAVQAAAGETALQVPTPLVIPPPSGEYPIDLATALRLADVANPTIAAARAMILEALALQMTARSLLLPSLNSGISYHGHTGDLQRSSGRIIDVYLQSLYMGAGANTVVAGTVVIPGVSILTPLSDAWFEPLVARQRVLGARFRAQATANDVLLDVALLDLELLGSQSLLEAQRLSEAQAYEIVRTTQAYADTGEGRPADAERAKAEWRYRRADVQKAEEALAVTAARLANRLNLDPAVRLRVVGGPIVPLYLIDLETPPQELIKVALKRRPELAARDAGIAQAEAYVKEEVARPLVPTLWLGFSGGAFGGGSNMTPPLLGHFASRTDFDVGVYWTLLNLGAGNVALIRRRQAEVGEAVAARQRTINRIRDEVMAALADAKAAQNQIEMARRELASSQPGYEQDLARARENQGLPIEVVNSLTLVAAARVHLVQALVAFDQAQFRLWVALGSPPPLEQPPAPIRPIVAGEAHSPPAV